MSEWANWLAGRAAQREERGTTRTIGVLRDAATIDLAGNDYLGLSRDPRIVAAAIEQVEQYGAGAAASRLVTGTLQVHEDLEAALAQLCGQRSALVFASGYAANLGAVTAFVDRDTSILLDEHAHASLHDAARMSRAPHGTFAHNDVAALDAALSQQRGRSIVTVESVYSVLGDAAPLIELAQTCARHGALLIIDEAHGIGVAGEGRGLAHALGVAGAPDVGVTAPRSKALGAQGGVVLGSPAVREHLINAARTFIFDTGLAPAAAGAALAAVDVVQREPDTVAAIGRHAAQIAAALDITPSAGAVLSVPMRSPAAALAARDRLRQRGVLVGCFRPPSTPDQTARLRLTARADLTDAQVEFATGEVRRAIGC